MFRHCLAPIALGISAVVMVAWLLSQGEFTLRAVLLPAYYVLALAFSLWLRARGHLRPGPNNSSKPKPLRGSA